MGDTAGNKYGEEKAYSYAKPSKHGGKENWLKSEDQAERLREYEVHAEKFKKKHQEITDLARGTFAAEKGDTLFPILKDNFKMNGHLAFLVMIKLLKEGVNVDVLNAGDQIELDDDEKKG